MRCTQGQRMADQAAPPAVGAPRTRITRVRCRRVADLGVEALCGVVGAQAVVTFPTRGADGPGEVTVEQGGGTEVYIAWSAEPLAKGTPVVIYAIRGARDVDVEPITPISTGG